MKKLTSTLFATALMLSPATICAQPDTADTEKKVAQKADQEVVVEANDQMQFNKKAFEIKAGDTVNIGVHSAQDQIFDRLPVQPTGRA